MPKLKSLWAVVLSRLVLLLDFFGRVLPLSGCWPVATENMITELNETVGKNFIGWLVDKCPDLARRMDRLPALIATLGLDRVIAEANRKPVHLLIPSLGRARNSGKHRVLLNHDGEIRKGMEKNLLGGEQGAYSVDGLIATPRPNHNVGIGAVQHPHVAGEAWYISTEFRKGDVLAITDKCEDGVFHSLENDERMRPYQRGRASITGLRLKLREIMATGRLVGVA